MDCEEPALFDLDQHPTGADGNQLATTGALLPSVVYRATFVEPVRRLNETLADVLDVETHPDRTPEQAILLLKSAMDTFNDESEGWL